MNEATLRFIREHADGDVRQLALRGSKDPEVELTFALEQIAGRQKAREKLPSWAMTDGIVYPPHLSMEQCSSEATARYKAAIADRLCGEKRSFVDLTGGFGVDFLAMASMFRQSIYVERQAQLCSISSQNFNLLGLHAEVVNADSVDYLRGLSPVSLLYIDPARRDAHGGRTFAISDCTPNLLEIRDLMLEKAEMVMVKLSPMLDWRKAVSDIGAQYVNEVHIVSVGNDCKELLLVLSRQPRPLRVYCVNDADVFDFLPDTADTVFSPEPLPDSRYLYEPNASVMKAGCFPLLESRYGVRQVERNSHLFVSAVPVASFPGRCFRIEAVSSMNKWELKERLVGISSANIAVRNFPLSVQELRKRLGLRDGGEVYIFATTVSGSARQLFICRKLA